MKKAFFYLGKLSEAVYNRRVELFMIMLFVLVLSPELGISAASSSGGNNPIHKTLCNVVNLLDGGVAKAIGTIAIIFLALGLFVGKVSWGVAVATGLGIGAMFGAEKIVNLVANGVGNDSSATGCTTTGYLFEYIQTYIS
jgi:type IV secretory pathway VirB2 component (pilin)